MKYLKKLATMALIAGMLFSLPVGAATTTPATTSNQPQNANQAQNNPEFQKSLTDSAAVAQSWLELIDNGQYGQSWDNGSALFKQTISKDEWNTFLKSIRKPMGTLVSRKVLDQRTAQNPPGLPAGDYMVMVYKTSFTNNNNSDEIVTLMKEGDGTWRVLTYQVK